MKKGFEHWRTNVSRTEDEIEKLSHGETVTKFITTDEGQREGDYGVEIHGFMTGSGDLIITHEILSRRSEKASDEGKVTS